MSDPFVSKTPVDTVVDAEFEEIAQEADIIQAPTEIQDYRHQLGMLPPTLVASILGVNWSTLKNWRSRKEGPSYIRIGKRIWYLYEDVQDWLHHNKEDTMANNTESGQRRDYRKTDSDPPTPAGKGARPVEHDSTVQPPPPDDVNQPPPGSTISNDPPPDSLPPIPPEEEQPPVPPEDDLNIDPEAPGRQRPEDPEAA